MPTHTYTLTGVDVPPTAVFSAGSAPTTGLSGSVDETPLLWPPSGKATALEVELTSTAAPTADGQVQVAVSQDGALTPLSGATLASSGTWSMADGVVSQFKSSAVDALFLDKFGGWRTDYLTFSASAAASNRGSCLTSSAATSAIDLQAQFRVASVGGATRRSIVASASQAELQLTSTGVALAIQWNGSTPSQRLTCDYATFGLAVNAWTWVRGTVDTTNGLRIWTSADGVSWSVVATAAILGGGTGFTNATTAIRAGGNGGGSLYGEGLDGDLAKVRFATSVGGTPDVEFNLDEMSSATDLSWPANGSESWTLSSTTSPVRVGTTVPDTVRARFEFEVPTDTTEWRLIVETDAAAEVSVDEIVLEMERRGGHHLGLVRGRRG